MSKLLAFPATKKTWQQEFQKANDIMLAGQAAARLTLNSIVEEFPNCAAITNHARAIQQTVNTQYRKAFEKTVELLFNHLTTKNTITN